MSCQNLDDLLKDVSQSSVALQEAECPNCGHAFLVEVERSDEELENTPEEQSEDDQESPRSASQAERPAPLNLVARAATSIWQLSNPIERPYVLETLWTPRSLRTLSRRTGAAQSLLSVAESEADTSDHA